MGKVYTGSINFDELSRPVTVDWNKRRPLTEQETINACSQRYEDDDPHWMRSGPEIIPSKNYYDQFKKKGK